MSRSRSFTAKNKNRGDKKMIEIIIDGKDLQTKKQAHEFFSEQEGFPTGYGKNLDALFDVLTSLPSIKVTVKSPRSIVENLGEYGKKLLLVIKDARDRNPGIVLCVEDDEQSDAEPECEECGCKNAEEACCCCCGEDECNCDCEETECDCDCGECN